MMGDSQILTQFVDKIGSLVPPAQASPDQSTPGGVPTFEVATIAAVNNTNATVNNLLAQTATVTYKGSSQSLPWIGDVPRVGAQVLIMVQPPYSCILGIPGQGDGSDAWVGLASIYNSGWSDLGGAQLGAYRVKGDQVFLRGLIKGGTGNIFTLPTGLGPISTEEFYVGGAGALCGIAVFSTGIVEMFFGSATSNLSLSGINWSIS